jgi:hypothetical protein
MKKHSEIVWLAAVAVIVVAIGTWGFALCGIDYPGGNAPRVPVNVRDPLLLFDCFLSSLGLIRLFNLYFPVRDCWQLVFAQVAVPGLALFSAARLLIAGVRKGLQRALASRKSNHAIVCGIGDAGMQVVQNLHEAGFEVVAVDKNKDQGNLAACEHRGVPTVHGIASDERVLHAAGLRKAAAVILTTGSDGENLEIAAMLEASGLMDRGPGRPRLRVMAEIRNGWMHKRLIASPRTGAHSFRSRGRRSSVARCRPHAERIGRQLCHGRCDPAVRVFAGIRNGKCKGLCQRGSGADTRNELFGETGYSSRRCLQRHVDAHSTQCAESAGELICHHGDMVFLARQQCAGQAADSPDWTVLYRSNEDSEGALAPEVAVEALSTPLRSRRM